MAAPAILQQGSTAMRVAIAAIVTFIGVSTDATAFNNTQTALDPANVGSANNLIQAAAITIVDFQTFIAQMTINGTTQMTNKAIATISAMNGNLRTNALTRTVRSQTIGVQPGDSFTIGIQCQIQDNS